MNNRCNKKNIVKHGYLYINAKLYINEFEKGHPFYKKQFNSPIRPNHRLKDTNYSLVGPIEFSDDTFDFSNNGNIVQVTLIAGEDQKKLIEKLKVWDLYAGSEHFGRMELVEIIGIEAILI